MEGCFPALFLSIPLYVLIGISILITTDQSAIVQWFGTFVAFLVWYIFLNILLNRETKKYR